MFGNTRGFVGMGDGLYEFTLTKILYTWNKYNSVENRTYKWNRFNVITTKKYCWKKYNVNQSSGETIIGRISVNIGDKVYCASGVRGSDGDYSLSGASNFTIRESGPTNAEREHYDIADYPYVMINGTSGASYYTVKCPPDVPITFGHWHNYSWWDDWTTVYAKLGKGEDLMEEIGTYPTMIEVGEKTTQGSLVGNVYSTSSSAYPTDGISGNYWYVRYSAGDTTEYSKGTANGSVTSSNSSAYPSNGKSGNYWYVSNGYTSSWSKGTLIGPVTTTQIDAYPDDGRHTDAFWYVKQT